MSLVYFLLEKEMGICCQIGFYCTSTTEAPKKRIEMNSVSVGIEFYKILRPHFFRTGSVQFRHFLRYFYGISESLLFGYSCKKKVSLIICALFMLWNINNELHDSSVQYNELNEDQIMKSILKVI